VNEDPLESLAPGQLKKSVEMSVHGMYALILHKADQVKAAVMGPAILDCAEERRIGEEAPVLDPLIDADHFLLDYPARAHIEMANLRGPLGAGGESNILACHSEPAMRIVLEKSVGHRGVGCGHCIAGIIRIPYAPAVSNDQNKRSVHPCHILFGLPSLIPVCPG
jgi:hypothetical protein